MNKIFVTSDSHAFHRNIAGPKVSAWKTGYRDFDDEWEMSRHIVKLWNQTVGVDDVLYFLGDWAFGGIDNIWKFRKQIKCKTIHLLLGNQDHHIAANKYIKVPAADKNILFSLDIPFDYTKDYQGFSQVQVQDLFASVNQVLTFKTGHNTFFCSHYSHRIWEGSHKGACHLYGHSHDSIPDFGKSMDVGIDSAKRILGDYRPFSIEELISLMDRKQVAFVDHHSKDTNTR